MSVCGWAVSERCAKRLEDLSSHRVPTTNIHCLTLGSFQVNTYLLEDPAAGAPWWIRATIPGLRMRFGHRWSRARNYRLFFASRSLRSFVWINESAAGISRSVDLSADAGTSNVRCATPTRFVAVRDERFRPILRDGVDQEVRDGDTIAVGALRFRFLFTPGTYAEPRLLLRR